MSKTAHQSFFDKCRQWEKVFLSIRDDVVDVEKSATFIPKTHEGIRGLVAYTEAAVFGSRPYGKAIARKAKGANNENKVTKLVDYQVDHADFEEISDLIFQDAFSYGSAPHLKTWEYETGLVPKMNQRIVGIDQNSELVVEDYLERDENGDIVMEEGEIFDGLKIYRIRIYDFFPPADATSHRPKDWLFAIRRYWASAKQLKEAGYYKNLDKLSTIGTGETKQTEQYTTQQKEDFRISQTGSHIKEYECLEYYTDRKIYAKIVGAEFLIRNQNNLYLKKPVGMGVIFPKTDRPWGFGMIEPSELMQKSFNNVVDVTMDEFNIEDNKPVIVSDDVQWDTINTGIRQRQIVKVAAGVDTRAAVSFVPPGGITQSAFQLITLFHAFLQSTLAFPDLAKGIPQMGIDTATEARVLQFNVSSLLQYFIKNLERSYAKPLFETTLSYCQLFLDSTKTYRILGENGAMEELTISPSEILGEYEFIFDWANREVNADVQISHINSFLQTLNQIQAFTPLHILILQKQLQNLRIHNKEDIDQALKLTYQQMQERQVQEMQAEGIGSGKTGQQPTNLTDVMQLVASSTAPNVQAGVPPT